MSGVDMKKWVNDQPIGPAEAPFPVVDLAKGRVVCAPGLHLDLKRIAEELKRQM